MRVKAAYPCVQQGRLEHRRSGSFHFSARKQQTDFISAREKDGISSLQNMLVEAAQIPSISQNDIIVSNVRHYEALTLALDSVHRVQDGLENNLSGDFISQDLRECIYHLSDIVGEVTTDEVLGNIFRHFCIGK